MRFFFLPSKTIGCEKSLISEPLWLTITQRSDSTEHRSTFLGRNRTCQTAIKELRGLDEARQLEDEELARGERDLHGLQQGTAVGQAVAAEGAQVAAAPVVDDVTFARAPVWAHRGTLEGLRKGEMVQVKEKQLNSVRAQWVIPWEAADCTPARSRLSLKCGMLLRSRTWRDGISRRFIQTWACLILIGNRGQKGQTVGLSRSGNSGAYERRSWRIKGNNMSSRWFWTHYL